MSVAAANRWPDVEAFALDFSPVILESARSRFRDEASVTVVEHDLDQPLPDLGRFDTVVSSFAVHHLSDVRKRRLYQEVHEVLLPGGVFANLEHVSSPTTALHHEFLAALDIAPAEEDPSNRLASVDVQLGWLCELGFVDVDCFWKWRELALLAGRVPGA